ncbi:MAG: Glycosyltransferase involved in cell wall bisynthesis [Chloroflexi bacterium]|jgi:glycosyltransferase involved in cell wall biosynthesis|nr:MAG: Glycosyltransferase involved in cell wall bisynthesis [Chloroflexota bacterium]
MDIEKARGAPMSAGQMQNEPLSPQLEHIPEEKVSTSRQQPKSLPLTFLHNTAAPYQVEFFNALAASEEGKSLQVYYCQLRHHNRPWKAALVHQYAYEVLRGLHFSLLKRTNVYHFNPGIVTRLLRRGRRNLWIICGYSDLTNQIAMVWRTILRQPWIMLTEEPERSSRRSPLRNLIRWALLFLIKRGSSGVIAFGARSAKDYFDEQMKGSIPVEALPQYLDVSPYLRIGKARIERHQRDGAPATVNFFYAGQVESFSGVDTLVTAFNQIARNSSTVRLHIVGSGSALNHVQQMVDPLVEDRITFHGTKEWNEMPALYEIADVFVHPSRGQGWGMVVNEALASGLPLVASEESGAARELVKTGDVGFLINPEDIGAMYESMKFFADNPEEIVTFAERAYETGKGLDISVGVRRFLDIVSDAVPSQPAPLQAQ